MHLEERYIPAPSILAKSMLYYVQHMGLSTFDDSYRIDRHNLSSILFTYTISGCGILEYKGQHHEVSEGSFMLINCREQHTYYTKKNSHWEQSWLHFYGSESEAYYHAIFKEAGPVITLPEEEPLHSYLEKLISLKRANDLHFEFRASCLIVQMLTDIVILSKQTTTLQLNEFVAQTINEIIKEMDNRLGEKYSVADMAQFACLSPSRFAVLFRQAVGMPPYEFLLRRRIEAAKDLLCSTDKPLSEIALLLGFDSASHFIRTFQRYESITPHHYRKIFIF